MILFLDDWKRFPTAIVNTETTNRSFVRLASVYREMGIKNHAFLLALVNRDLVGIDPFSPNLTVEQMMAIALECAVNPWFFFREVARAPAIAGTEAVMMEANRGNMALFWSFFNHIMIILIQIRQTGKSYSTDVLMTYLLNIKCQSTAINLMTKDDVLRRKNVERLKEIASELPRYLQQKGRDDANNGEEITIKSLKNTYTTHVPQASKKRAYNMGRGLTSPIFHIDEGPFQPNIETALPAALASTGAAVDRAKQEPGGMYGTILTTTAGKIDDPDGRYIFNMLNDSAVWTEKFFDARNAEELEMMVRRNSRAGKLRINATFNHRQLGKTDTWLREKLEESTASGDDANRDYFNMWTSGSLTNPLPLDVLERIAKSETPALYTDISVPHGYITRWYIPEQQVGPRLRNGKFILSMDTSEASGGDDISLYLTDVETAETIAVGTYNETNLITFAEWVCSILVTFKNITAIIERRSTGAFLLDYLLMMLPAAGEDPFKRLFNMVVNNYDEDPERWKEIQQPMGRRSQDIYVRYKKAFGFATSAAGVTSRTTLYSTVMQNAAKRAGDKVRDGELIKQITSLITKNGRVDHPPGGHDDIVIGWLLAHWLMTMGKNLSHYGIDTRAVLSAAKPHSQETPQQLQQRQEQKALREKIEHLYNQLANEHDQFISQRIEHELRFLDRKIVLENGEIYSVDELIRKAAEAKRTKRRQYDSSVVNHHHYHGVRPMHNEHGVWSQTPLSPRQILQHNGIAA